jgi:hypothetical protein
VFSSSVVSLLLVFSLSLSRVLSLVLLTKNRLLCFFLYPSDPLPPAVGLSGGPPPDPASAGDTIGGARRKRLTDRFVAADFNQRPPVMARAHAWDFLRNLIHGMDFPLKWGAWKALNLQLMRNQFGNPHFTVNSSCLCLSASFKG